MTILSVLQTDIATMTDRTDIGPKVVLFAKLARMYIEAHALRPEFLLVKQAAIPISSGYFALPTDTLGIQQVSLVTNNQSTILERKTEAFTRLNSALFKYYWKDHMSGYLGAQPSTSALIEIDYWQRQPDVFLGTDTNNWLFYTYDLMLHATLMYAYQYLKDLESLAAEKTALDALIKLYTNSAISIDQSTHRDEPGDL